MDNYTTHIAENQINQEQKNMVAQWSMWKFGYAERIIENARFIPERYAESNGFSKDFMYLSFQFPNEYNDMQIVPLKEKLKTATHFQQIISKN